MIRVLWLIKGLGPGGAERLLVSAASAHDRSSFAFEAAYVLPWKSTLVPALMANGIKVHCLDGLGGSDLRWLATLRRLLVGGGYDVVHAHSPLVAGVARIVTHTLPGHMRPVTLSTEHNAWSTFHLPTRLLVGATAGLDAGVIAVSEEARNSIWWPGVRARTEVVVHGVDLAALRAARGEREAVRRELQAGPDDVVVITVANYRAQKAYPDLLEAACRVLQSGLRVRFVAVGQGPLQSEIVARHAELGLGDQFRLLGFRDDVPRLLAGADVFTLASTYEGYPVAMMEALAAGLPVVATAVGGVRQAVRDGIDGLLVPPGRPDLLAAALADVVLDGSRRRAMASAAHERGAGYDITIAVRRIELLYRRVVAARGPKAERR